MLKREPAGRADRLRGRRTQCAARVASSTEITACRRVRATGDLCQDLWVSYRWADTVRTLTASTGKFSVNSAPGGAAALVVRRRWG